MQCLTWWVVQYHAVNTHWVIAVQTPLMLKVSDLQGVLKLYPVLSFLLPFLTVELCYLLSWYKTTPNKSLPMSAFSFTSNQLIGYEVMVKDFAYLAVTITGYMYKHTCTPQTGFYQHSLAISQLWQAMDSQCCDSSVQHVYIALSWEAFQVPSGFLYEVNQQCTLVVFHHAKRNCKLERNHHRHLHRMRDPCHWDVTSALWQPNKAASELYCPGWASVK